MDFDLSCDSAAETETLTIDYIVNDSKFHTSPFFPLGITGLFNPVKLV